MKVKIVASFCGKEVEGIIEINENSIKGDGYMSRNKLNNLAKDWAENKLYVDYSIVEDDRFDDEINNMPYVDAVTKERLGWK